jgi:hypothetical protein
VTRRASRAGGQVIGAPALKVDKCYRFRQRSVPSLGVAQILGHWCSAWRNTASLATTSSPIRQGWRQSGADHPGVLVACLENESQDRAEAFELLRAQVPLTVGTAECTLCTPDGASPSAGC